ncbi:MAG TPA: hypothetical protein PKJ75_05810, partial [Methanosarcina vacuolata]|nr:hypothetical protein [Methanosarcina vacuolata]
YYSYSLALSPGLPKYSIFGSLPSYDKMIFNSRSHLVTKLNNATADEAQWSFFVATITGITIGFYEDTMEIATQNNEESYHLEIRLKSR